MLVDVGGINTQTKLGSEPKTSEEHDSSGLTLEVPGKKPPIH